MEQEQVHQFVTAHMDSVFAFCMARLHHRQDAEDLAAEIMAAMLRNAKALRDDGACYGYLWAVARNLYKKHLRSLRGRDTAAFHESFTGVYWTTPEDTFLEKEQLHMLRRELAHIGDIHRRVTVQYYIHNRSCSEIAASQKISVSLVKYYLLQSRKQLREGIPMTREYGERSYNPGTFVMNFWGTSCAGYHDLFQRKLPCNIVLSAYDHARSLSELSMDLGVSTAYLKEETDLLLEYGILTELPGGKLAANLIVFTQAYEQEVYKAVRQVYRDAAGRIGAQIAGLESTARQADFIGGYWGQNALRWLLWVLAVKFATEAADARVRECMGGYPALKNGGSGFVFGQDSGEIYSRMNGIYGYCLNRDETAWFSVFNYRAIANSQNWQPVRLQESMEAMTDAILQKPAAGCDDILVPLIRESYIHSEHGRLSANFPVLSSEAVDRMRQLLKPVSGEVFGCITAVAATAGDILKRHAPRHLQARCEPLAFVQYELETQALILEALVEDGVLSPSLTGEKLGMFGVVN